MAYVREYRIGRRLTVFRNIFFALATALLFGFYFVYDFVFGAAFPWLKGAPLIAIFLLLEAGILALGKWWCDRLTRLTLYRVTDEALEVTLGTSHFTYPWSSFERAWFGMVDFAGGCPITYQVKGQKFKPSTYLEGVWTMHAEIVERIKPYAQIEEGLESKISAFS